MRRSKMASLFSTLFVFVGSLASGADFPRAADLPSHPELPDPLVSFDGRRVTSKETWERERRPELKRLFRYYMYGAVPEAPTNVSATVDREDARALDGKATLREVTLSFGPPQTPRIHLLLLIPNARPKPVAAFVGLNFCGNHTVLNDPKIALPSVWMPEHCPGVKEHQATDAGRGTQVDVWAADEVIGRGYALATLYSGDVAPDHPGLADGVFPHYLKRGESKPGPHDWAVVAAWAWGLSRAVDYLTTVSELDRRRIAVVGHSRLGKAALVAGAFDERIALCIPHEAGCGGSAPSRGTVGESVKRINSVFPHWFDAEFKEFNDHPDKLPFDQNALVALVAPRPVLLTNAVDDQWANPAGQFDVLKAADPVYRLLGVTGLDVSKMPEPNVLVGTNLGYHIRPGKHSMGREDWKVFLEFADQHLGKDR